MDVGKVELPRGWAYQRTMSAGFFVTGTDTDAGKTFVTCLLVRALRKRGIDAVGMKPFCCGGREDAEALYAANEGAVEMGLVNPVWLRVPAAPYTASLIENRLLDVETARETFFKLRARHERVVVEGVGGWRVPLTRELCMSRFAADLGLPVVLVAANRLGALNHTRLTLDAIRASGLPVAGILWNEVRAGEGDPARLTNRSVFGDLEPGEFLGEVAFGAPELESTVLQGLLPQRA